MIFTNRQDALNMVGTIAGVAPVVPSSYVETVLDTETVIRDVDAGDILGYDVDMALYFMFMYKAELVASGGVTTSFTSEGSSVTRSAPDSDFFLKRAEFYRRKAMGLPVDGGGLYIAAELESHGDMNWWAGGHVQHYDPYYGWAYPWWSFAYGNVPDDWDGDYGAWIVGGDSRVIRTRP